jgi:hypothetical protein
LQIQRDGLLRPLFLGRSFGSFGGTIVVLSAHCL